ncbi:BspA family leucine-rich repeat surface protein, partial [Mesoplasma chauliocola]
IGEKDSIDEVLLQAELEKAVASDMTESEAIEALEAVIFTGVTRLEASVNSPDIKVFEETKFNVKVFIDEANYEISKNTFVVSGQRIGQKDEIDYDNFKQVLNNAVTSDMTELEAIEALESVEKPDGVESVEVNKKSSRAFEEIAFIIQITIDEENYYITSKVFEIVAPRIGEKDPIDEDDLQIVLDETVSVDMTESEAINALESVPYHGLTSIKATISEIETDSFETKYFDVQVVIDEENHTITKTDFIVFAPRIGETDILHKDDVQKLLTNKINKELTEDEAIEILENLNIDGLDIITVQKQQKSKIYHKQTFIVTTKLHDDHHWDDPDFNGEFLITSEKIVLMDEIDTSKIYSLYDKLLNLEFFVSSKEKLIDLAKSIAAVNLTERQYNSLDFTLVENQENVKITLKVKDEYKNRFSLKGGNKEIEFNKFKISENNKNQSMITENASGNLNVTNPNDKVNDKDIIVYQIGAQTAKDEVTAIKFPTDVNKVTRFLPKEITSLAKLFHQSRKFEGDHNIAKWDTSNIINMSFTFAYAINFNIDLSKWNVSNVIDMTSMFQSAEIYNHDLSKWNVKNVKYYENFSTGTHKWEPSKKPIFNK